MKAAVVLFCLLLVACANYSPHPLTEESPALASPDQPSLAGQAAAIDRPYLKPHPVDLAAPLDGDSIAILAVLANPDLKALRSRAGVADAQAFAARLLPDPVFGAGIDHLLSGPDPVDNLAASLGLDINALRTLSSRRQEAEATARQAHMDLAWAEWQTACDARIQAVRIHYLQRIESLAFKSRDTLMMRLAHVRAGLERGDLPAARLQVAQTAAGDAEQKATQAAQDLNAARHELNRLLGLPPDYRLDIAPIPLPNPPPDAGQLYQAALDLRPDLAALRDGYKAAEASVHRAVLDQFPSLDLSINATRDTGRNRLLGPSVSFTLPLWNRNRGGIATARATRAALKAEYEARLFQTRADIATAVAGLGLARRQLDDLDGGLPELQRFAEANRTAAARGDLSQDAAETAEQALRDRQELVAQTALAINEQDIALELLTGAPREQWK